MELDEAVRTFLSTKPDPGDPGAPIGERRRAIRAGGGPPLRLHLLEVPPLDLTLDGMRASGVPVSHSCYPGAVHGSLALTGTWAPARTWPDDLLRSLREAHS